MIMEVAPRYSCASMGSVGVTHRVDGRIAGRQRELVKMMEFELGVIVDESEARGMRRLKAGWAWEARGLAMSLRRQGVPEH